MIEKLLHWTTHSTAYLVSICFSLFASAGPLQCPACNKNLITIQATITYKIVEPSVKNDIIIPPSLCVNVFLKNVPDWDDAGELATFCGNATTGSFSRGPGGHSPPHWTFLQGRQSLGSVPKLLKFDGSITFFPAPPKMNLQPLLMLLNGGCWLGQIIVEPQVDLNCSISACEYLLNNVQYSL